MALRRSMPRWRSCKNARKRGIFFIIPERVTSPTLGANFLVNRPLTCSKGFDSEVQCEVREGKKWGRKE